MAGNGPPPNPNAVRRNTRVGLIKLPAEGRKGRIPRWPLPENPRLTARITVELEAIEALEEKELDEDGLSRTEATKLTRARLRLAIAEAEKKAILDTEKELWRKLWRTPQAAEWERMSWDREVAQYVRHKAAAEIGSLDDSREARQRADSLGLTPKGMKALMWVIVEDELAAQRGAQPAAATGTEGRGRRRLSAVDPSGS